MLLFSRTEESSVLKRLGGYFGKQKRSVELVSDEYQMIGIGDPIFLLGGEGEGADAEAVQVRNVAYIAVSYTHLTLPTTPYV